jgi:hypothetical protein
MKKKVGRPAGTKNPPGAKVGRPKLDDKKITKSILVRKSMIEKIDENIEGKSFSDRVATMIEFYFKNN